MVQMSTRSHMAATRFWPAILASLLAIVLASCGTTNTVKTTDSKRQASSNYSLPGQIAAVQSHAQDAGALDQQRELSLSIALPLRNQAKLRAFLANLTDPGSPFYHQYLTTSGFTDDYGPTVDTVRNVSDYLAASGLQVTGTSPTRQFINVKGSVANIQSAFHVQLHKYTYQNKSYYGPVGNPAVTSSLAGLIQNVSGLDNFGVYHHNSILRANASGYTPQDIQKAYGIDSLISQGIDGSGQTIALMELDDYKDSDISSFQQKYNIAGGTLTRVPVDGGVSSPADGAAEVSLDIEIAQSVAPKANQLIYEGPNTGQGINDIYSQIVSDNKAKQVSISWGLCESQSGSAEIQTLGDIFAQGAAEGISFFAASGDDGAYDCGDNNLSVDSPADDPNVTGVGGTSLTLNNGSYGSETAWSCTDSTCTQYAPNGAGGGGGVSTNFPLPSFQQNIHPTDAGDATGRYVPDVSANADPQTGYAIYCTVSAAQCDGDMVVGGTSAAAPVWAGAAALINQSLGKQNKQLGNANGALYGVAQGASNTFHDVTNGNNLHYKAASGYDLATGLGSPNVSALASAIASGNYGSGGGTGGGTPQPTTTPGTPRPTSTTGGGGTGSGQELLVNNGFENGQSPWVQSSEGNYQLIDDIYPHKGTYAADLCGYNNCNDTIAQGFVVPQSLSGATLSYYWYMVTNETGSSCKDHFTVQLMSVTSDGSLDQVLQAVQQTCNTDANNSFAQKSIDITNALNGYKGQVVAVVFHTESDGQLPTRAFVDDVSIKSR
jgi:subtilase family serine protease